MRVPRETRAAGILLLSILVLSCEPPAPEGGLHFTPETVARNFRGKTDGLWNPEVSPAPQLRGGVYQKVAPAVVVVRTRYGFGTGFLVEGDMAVTALHVITDGWFVDQQQSATYVFVYFGKLDNGLMELCDEPVRGYVVDIDREQDLALLSVPEMPEQCGSRQPLALANERPTPETPCAIVGHPTTGRLWSYRVGVVSNAGKSPGDLVRYLIPTLGMSEENQEQYRARIAMMGTQDIVFTDIGSGPGDSGGPLVNMEGELIGVTCAVPPETSDARFTYHIDLQPVRQLLEQPTSDRGFTLYAPYAYQISEPVLLLKQPFVLTGSSGLDVEPTKFLIDLDQDTPQELLRQRDFVQLIDGRQFDAELAVHLLPDRAIVFYDTDDQKGMDEILIYEKKDRPVLRLRLESDSTWHLDMNLDVPWLDPSLFAGRQSRKALIQVQSEVRITVPASW